MSTLTILDDRNLPPKVYGRCRGILELQFEKIQWDEESRNNSPSSTAIITAKNIVGIQAKVIWWGESCQAGAIIKIDTRRKDSLAASEQKVRYNIRTNSRLFQEYIKNCEPIEIKLNSLISNLQIGTAFVEIPKELIKFFDGSAGGGCVDENKLTLTILHKSYSVFSPKNQILGKISISFAVYLSENHFKMVSPIVLSTKREAESESYHGSVKCLLNETANILKEKNQNDLIIKVQSPTPTQQLNSISPAGSSTFSIVSNDWEGGKAIIGKFINKIDSLMVKVYSLKLTKAGEREVFQNNINNDETTFIIECQPNPFILRTSPNKDDLTAMRFIAPYKYSTVIDTKQKLNPIEILINKQMVRGVRVPDYAIQSKHLDSLNIKFSIWSRMFGKEIGQLLSTFIIETGDILELADLTYTKIIPLKSISGPEIILGEVQVQIAFGCRGVHFGVDFFEALCGYKDHCIQPILGNNIQQQDNPQTFRTYSGGGGDGDGNGSDANHQEQQKMENNNSNTDVNKKIDNNFTQNQQQQSQITTDDKKIQENETKILHGLLYIGTIQFTKQFSTEETDNHFIMWDGFWQDEKSSTRMCENNVFNYLETFPLICNSKLFDRTRNQYLELELWKNHQNGSKAMQKEKCGTTNIPLHQFYVAFHDKIMMEHLCRTKLPVISIDGWSNIISICTQSASVLAKLQVLLAIGTEEQLEYLKSVRGLAQSYLSQEEILKNKIPIPSFLPPPPPPPPQQQQRSACTTSHVETQTNFHKKSLTDRQIGFIEQEATLNAIPSGNRQAILSEMLTNFIDNLAASLPERQVTDVSTTLAMPPIIPPVNTKLQQSLNSVGTTSGGVTPSTSFGCGSGGSNIQIRRTSDLLDTLQRALMCPPPPSIISPQQQQPPPPPASSSSTSSTEFYHQLSNSLPLQSNTTTDAKISNIQTENDPVFAEVKTPQSPPISIVDSDEIIPLPVESPPPPPPASASAQPSLLSATPEITELTEPHFHVLIEIENAFHISKVLIRVNKKCGKQRGRSNNNNHHHHNNKATTRGGFHEVEPSTYVTFEANGPLTSVVQSPEGLVYTTNVAEKTSSPQWNKRFEVLLPVDLMINDEKRFILKIWRKASTDIPQARLLPNPIEDVIVGFTAIDLSVLLVGMPTISGWYNIIDFAGRINGQIKVNIHPKENLEKYRPNIRSMISNSKTTLVKDKIAVDVDNDKDTTKPLSIEIHNSIDVDDEDDDDINNGSVCGDGGTILSRTLKRKFTELEEITQRLRARLFDITGDVNIDPDDEFEMDLNTQPNEIDDDDDNNMFCSVASGSNDLTNVNWFEMINSGGGGAACEVLPSQQQEQEQNIATTNCVESINSAFNKEIMYTKQMNHDNEDKKSLNWDKLLNDDDDDDDTIIAPKQISSDLSDFNEKLIEDNCKIISPPIDFTRNQHDEEENLSDRCEQDRIKLISNALKMAQISEKLDNGCGDAANEKLENKSIVTPEECSNIRNQEESTKE